MPSRGSAEYWADRTAAHTWDAYNTAVDECRALQDVYSKAQRDIDAQLMQLLKKSQSGKLSLTDGYTIKRLKAIKANIQKTVDRLKEAEKQQLGEVLKEAYQINYEALRAELMDRAFTTVNKKAVEKALKYPWSGADFSDRIWRDKASLTFALNEILTRGLVQGLGVGELARQIDGKMQSGYKNALRLARTETIHYLNDSALQAYRDSGVKKVQFWAAEDERTCPECGALHSKEYPIDKAPVLPLHPNCRCTYIPVVDLANDVELEETKPDKVKPDKAEPEKAADVYVNTNTRGHIATHYGVAEFDGDPEGRIAQIMDDTGYSHDKAELVEKYVQDYFGDYYQEVRERETDYFKTVSDELDALIRLSPKYEGPITRGIAITEDIADTFAVGDEIDMMGISSWTSDPYVSDNFSTQKGSCRVIFRLDDPYAGSALSYLSKYGLQESEITFPSFATFKIIEVEKTVPTKIVEKTIKSEPK